MLRLSEVALFLAPFALAVCWFLLGTRGRAFFWTALAALLLLGSAVVWFGLGSGLPRGGTYVPARVQAGRIVPGHGS